LDSQVQLVLDTTYWIGVQAEFGITEMSFAKIGVTFKFGGDK
jgi:hypothetical protein